MIHTSLSPNAQKDDIFLALSLLMRPFAWYQKKTVAEVEEAVRETIGVPHAVTVDSGRTALYTLLKAFGISEGDEVIVQAYTCVAVPDPVLWVGAKPVYVDCDNDLTLDVGDLQKKITAATKVIVVQHTFGMPARMREILAVAKARGIFVIEDCAHSLGATFAGAPLGSLADAAFFSFGRDKCISSVFGGAIATSSLEVYEKVLAVARSYPLPSPIWVTRQLLHPPILALSKATYNTFGIGRFILAAARRLHIISKAVEPKELRGKRPSFTKHAFSPALAALALNQFRKLSEYTRHRQACAETYAEKLQGMQGIELPARNDGRVYLRYTVFVEDPSKYRGKARAQGIELGDWYNDVLAPSGVRYAEVGYNQGSCPNAERLAERSLNLPTHIGITPRMINEIITHVFV
ncbi:MAG: aminotransferase class I/II-fold pyridoxal phosphate-dependent enzyme [Patescibacteria group bacterium]|nr:aminotransferase class I/II-fold pyridoxal phosphate-dependent enzyme [Patescibacteria group bacterium]